jgi:dTMP kinase
MAGPLITFEGGEGAGKSSQALRLAERLRASGYRVLSLHEPGGTPLGDAVYGWLRDPGSRALQRLYTHWASEYAGQAVLAPLAELFLFEAARAQLMAQVLRPALEDGRVVVCDRFTDSTTAYQGYGRGIPLEQVEQANNLATGGLRPALTFLFDLSPEAGLARTRGPDHRMEREGIAFHRRVRDGYLAIAKREPQRVVIVDATRPMDEIERQVWERVEQALSSVMRDK